MSKRSAKSKAKIIANKVKDIVSCADNIRMHSPFTPISETKIRKHIKTEKKEKILTEFTKARFSTVIKRKAYKVYSLT